MLREFNHVNPQDDEEGKVFVNTRVSVCFTIALMLKLIWPIFSNYINLFDIDSLLIFGCLKNLLHLNVAACYLKMGECRKSIETCNKVCLVIPNLKYAPSRSKSN